MADCRKFVASVPFLPIPQLTLATQDPGVLEATIRLISYLYEYGDRWVVSAELPEDAVMRCAGLKKFKRDEVHGSTTFRMRACRRS